MRYILPLVLIAAVCFAIGWMVKPASDRNATLTYGERTGLPKNCRAIIVSNIEGWQNKTFTPTEALSSIDRNCGRNGYSWGE